MSNKTTRDADGHPNYKHRGKHSKPTHHVGPCSPACRAGRSEHHHRRSGEKMTPRIAQRIYDRYYRRDKKRGYTTKRAKAEASRVSGSVVRRAAMRRR